jgi:hypothetical protein
MKWEMTGIKVVVAYFKILSQHFIRKYEENEERSQSGYL